MFSPFVFRRTFRRRLIQVAKKPKRKQTTVVSEAIPEVKIQKVEFVPEDKLCAVCGKVSTHRLVNGIRTCSICLEAKIQTEG